MIYGCAFSLTQQLRHSALTASDGKRSCKSTLLECTIGDVCACARVHVYVLIISCPNGRWCNGVSLPTSDSSHLLSTFFIQHAQLCGHLYLEHLDETWHTFQSNLWQWPHWFSSSAFVSKHVLHLSFSTLLDFLPLLSVRQMRLSSTQPLHSAASAIVGKLHRLLKIEQPATLQDFFFSPGEKEGRGPKAKMMHIPLEMYDKFKF